MAFMRPEFGKELRALLAQRRLSYREVQRLTGVSFSQVGDLCRGLVRTRSQVEKLIAGLGLDPQEWLVKAGYVPDGIAEPALLQALAHLGEVISVPAATLSQPTYDGVRAGDDTLVPIDVPLGPTIEAIRPFDYSVRVRGDSMAGILEDGDLAFVKQQSTASAGDLVIALVRDAVVVKRYRNANGMVTLASANDRYEEIPASEVRILGVVTGFYRTP